MLDPMEDGKSNLLDSWDILAQGNEVIDKCKKDRSKMPGPLEVFGATDKKTANTGETLGH